MISKIADLKTQRAAALSSLDAMATRALTPEEQTAFDAVVAQVGEIDSRVAELEAAMNSEAAVATNSSKLETLKRSQRKSPAISSPNYVADVSDKKQN